MNDGIRILNVLINNQHIEIKKSASIIKTSFGIENEQLNSVWDGVYGRWQVNSECEPECLWKYYGGKTGKIVIIDKSKKVKKVKN